MPPCASRNDPARSATAPVNAPRTWPNSRLSRSSAEMAAQLTGTKGALARHPCVWIARATTSLPVPVSPSRSTVASLSASRPMDFCTSRMAALDPTRSPSLAPFGGVLASAASAAGNIHPRRAFSPSRPIGLARWSAAPSRIASIVLSLVGTAVSTATGGEPGLALIRRSSTLPSNCPGRTGPARRIEPRIYPGSGRRRGRPRPRHGPLALQSIADAVAAAGSRPRHRLAGIIPTNRQAEFSTSATGSPLRAHITERSRAPTCRGAGCRSQLLRCMRASVPPMPGDCHSFSASKMARDVRPFFPPLKSRVRGCRHAHRVGVSLFGRAPFLRPGHTLPSRRAQPGSRLAEGHRRSQRAAALMQASTAAR